MSQEESHLVWQLRGAMLESRDAPPLASWCSSQVCFNYLWEREPDFKETELSEMLMDLFASSLSFKPGTWEVSSNILHSAVRVLFLSHKFYYIILWLKIFEWSLLPSAGVLNLRTLVGGGRMGKGNLWIMLEFFCSVVCVHFPELRITDQLDKRQTPSDLHLPFLSPYL